jgi:hypothetical protein
LHFGQTSRGIFATSSGLMGSIFSDMVHLKKFPMIPFAWSRVFPRRAATVTDFSSMVVEPFMGRRIEILQPVPFHLDQSTWRPSSRRPLWSRAFRTRSTSAVFIVMPSPYHRIPAGTMTIVKNIRTFSTSFPLP